MGDGIQILAIALDDQGFDSRVNRNLYTIGIGSAGALPRITDPENLLKLFFDHCWFGVKKPEDLGKKRSNRFFCLKGGNQIRSSLTFECLLSNKRCLLVNADDGAFLINMLSELANLENCVEGLIPRNINQSDRDRSAHFVSNEYIFSDDLR